MTPRRPRKTLRERLRAIAGRPDADDDSTRPRTRLTTASFEHSHRVWIPPDPPRRWFERQGIEPAETRRWWQR